MSGSQLEKIIADDPHGTIRLLPNGRRGVVIALYLDVDIKGNDVVLTATPTWSQRSTGSLTRSSSTQVRAVST